MSLPSVIRKCSIGLLLWLCACSLQAQFLRVDSIRVEGLEKTREVVILRELTFTVGDTLEGWKLDEILDQSRKNLYNLNIFNDVLTEHEVVGSSLRLTIIVKERWYIWPYPYAAFEERTFNEWWQDKDLDRAVYGANLEWYNFSGYNDKLIAGVQGGYSKRITVGYRRPFLFPKLRLDGQFFLRFVNRKEIGYVTEQGVLQLARLRTEPMQVSYQAYAELARRFSPRTKLYFTGEYNYFRPSDSIYYFNPDYLTVSTGAEHYPSVGVYFINDQRDVREFPLSGHKINFGIEQNGLPGVGTAHFTSFTAGFSQHIAFNKRFNFAFGSQNYGIIGKRVPYFDKQFVGILTDIRGYETYVIDGDFINMTKAEFKFGLVPRTIVHIPQIPFRKFQDFPIGLYISVFCDAGYVRDQTFNNRDNFLKDELLYGYGVGLNVVGIYDLHGRIEYTINHLGIGGFYVHASVSIQ